MTYRTNLEKDIKSIQYEIIKMCTMTEKYIDKTLDALMTQDIDLAKKIIQEDDVFDQQQVKIEGMCADVIALQQPLASDLRRIISIQRITTDIERIADQCCDICYYTIKIANEVYIKPLIDIPSMANEVKKMMKMAIDAYIKEETDLALQVIKNDDIVDAYFTGIYEELQALIIGGTEGVDQCLAFLMISKYLERMADHATNIAESVIYIVDGKLKKDILIGLKNIE